MIRSYRRESGVVTVEIEGGMVPLERRMMWQDLTLAEFREFCTEGLKLCEEMEKEGPRDPR